MPSQALAPQVDGFLGTERLGKELPTTKVKDFDVLADDVEETIIALCEILKHESMPFSQRRGNFVDDRL